MEIKETIRHLSIKSLYFMGGEPTLARDLTDLLRFAKEELGLTTRLGHTNGCRLPLPYLNVANVGLKAWDTDLHRAITGQDRNRILANVANAHAKGINLKINIVYVPGLIDLDQVEGIAAWVASVDKNIPFNIMGYIPVPGQPYPQPSIEQMTAAEEISKRHLRDVSSSRLSPDNVLRLADRDDRFAVTRLL